MNGKQLTTPRLTLVDVTLRDGGFLNNWCFTKAQIADHIDAVSPLVDVVELGYLSTKTTPGMSASCPVPLLEAVKAKAPDSKLGAMVSGAGCGAGRLDEALSRLVDVVRVTVAISRPEPALDACAKAVALGFDVCANLTNVSAFPIREIAATAELFAGLGLSALYCADSRGALDEDQAAEIVSAISHVVDGQLGFHAHNNCGLALANTTAAAESGCAWVDASVSGYGLGGSNLELRALLQSPLGSQTKSAQAHSGVDLERLLSAAESNISLAPSPEGPLAYRLSGERNLNQEWVPTLMEMFSEDFFQRLEALPRDNYSSLETAVTAMRALASLGAPHTMHILQAQNETFP